MVTCRRCGKTGTGAEPHVSVRALILALARFEISSKEQARALEKAWAEYRKQRRLDKKERFREASRKFEIIDGARADWTPDDL
jgi:hypothetical protein